MKTIKATITSLIALVAVVIVVGSAQATTFSVSSILSNRVGDTENFKWAVTTTATSPFNLDLGEFRLITYGRFLTDDFGFDQADLTDNDDSFRASLNIVPPTASVSGIGAPDATKFLWLAEMVQVDFDNHPITVNYGNGGKYTVTFLDSFLFHNGCVDLNVIIHNETEPVPEPGTMMLLGTAMLVIALYGKRCRKI